MSFPGNGIFILRGEISTITAAINRSKWVSIAATNEDEGSILRQIQVKYPKPKYFPDYLPKCYDFLGFTCTFVNDRRPEVGFAKNLLTSVLGHYQIG